MANYKFPTSNQIFPQFHYAKKFPKYSNEILRYASSRGVATVFINRKKTFSPQEPGQKPQQLPLSSGLALFCIP
jgi:hypothetical protein